MAFCKPKVGERGGGLSVDCLALIGKISPLCLVRGGGDRAKGGSDGGAVLGDGLVVGVEEEGWVRL